MKRTGAGVVSRALLPVVAGLALMSHGPAALGRCDAHEWAKFGADDGTAGDVFGYGMALSGNHAIIGAFGDEPFGENSGSAYIFYLDDNGTPLDRSDDAWVQQAWLVGSHHQEYDNFGVTVSIDGDYAIVGAPFDPDEGDDPGSAYIFRRDDAGTPTEPSDDTWVQQARLLAYPADPGDMFGKSVFIRGDYAIAGTPGDDDACGSPPNCDTGAAYVFRRHDGGTPADPSDDTWVQAAKIFADPAWRGADLGSAVAHNGDFFMAGAPEHNPGGQVVVFLRDDGDTPDDPADDVWLEHSRLIPHDTELEDKFGTSLALDDDFAVVGSVWDSDGGSRSGSAYVFRRNRGGTPDDPSDDTWIEEAKLTAGDAEAYDWFGFRVAIHNNYILAGALFNADAGAASCSAYLFRRDEDKHRADNSRSIWVEVAKITSSDLAAGDHFGVSVALDADIAMIGAHGDDDNGSGSGSVYVIRGVSDCNGNGAVDLCDVSSGGSLDINRSGLPDECEGLGDLDGDGGVDLGDYELLGPCLGGPGVTDPPVGCDPQTFDAADLDRDDDVDLFDFIAFGLFFTR